uniref:Uncharacterized protein n=1 Tax=Arundo donax TaxID=35708 RepID=A0A0A8Z919_ARUDO
MVVVVPLGSHLSGTDGEKWDNVKLEDDPLSDEESDMLPSTNLQHLLEDDDPLASTHEDQWEYISLEDGTVCMTWS